MTADPHGADRNSGPDAGVAALDPAEAAAAERLAIRKRAMDFLARREHAYAELVVKLRKREHAADEIGPVLDELVDDGLLSDARYAEAVVRSKSERGIGPQRIRAELTAVGVGDGVIDMAFENVPVDWFALANAVRRKRFGNDVPTDFPTRAKQMRFLQRRGFDTDQLRAAFDD
ncbi:regulatory protein RecX [Salinisphaera sp. T31B1]|uniref:regulatory protein RecX n=1 Tax=Salinisphaera sp. T31B1 TaxID=727963 RepID=UPI003342B2BC